jgi:hypothetical protein
MKVRYWNSQKFFLVPSPKELVSQIKYNGTVVVSLPTGDIPVNHTFYLLGGRGSIAQLLASSGNNNFYGVKLRAMYLRFNGGIGKHYTVVAIAADTAHSALGDKKGWTDFNIGPPRSSARDYGLTGFRSPAASTVTTISHSSLATALRSAEAKMTDLIIDISGI